MYLKKEQNITLSIYLKIMEASLMQGINPAGMMISSEGKEKE